MRAVKRLAGPLG